MEKWLWRSLSLTSLMLLLSKTPHLESPIGSSNHVKKFEFQSNGKKLLLVYGIKMCTWKYFRNFPCSFGILRCPLHMYDCAALPKHLRYKWPIGFYASTIKDDYGFSHCHRHIMDVVKYSTLGAVHKWRHFFLTKSLDPLFSEFVISSCNERQRFAYPLKRWCHSWTTHAIRGGHGRPLDKRQLIKQTIGLQREGLGGYPPKIFLWPTP